MEVNVSEPAAATRTGATAGTRSTSVSEQIATALARHGVQYIIGQSIPSAITLAAVRLGITQILCRTEKDGAIVGDGYARITNRIPVVTSCSGPGTLLLAAGLGEALMASIPLVALIQDIPRIHRDRNAAQDLDDMAVLEPVTKVAWRVDRADRVIDYVDRAFVVAGSGRPGPVALLLAPEMLAEPAVAPEFRRDEVCGHFPLDRIIADPASVARAAEWIGTAERPVVIAGGGVHVSQAQPELAALVEQACLPVGATTMGKGAFDESHPLALGSMTYAIGHRANGKFTKPIVDEADLVVLIGTRTNQNGTNSWKLLPKAARFIHIDIDPAEVGRTYQALRLVGDAKLTLAALNAALASRDLGTRRAAKPELVTRIAEARRRHAAEIAPAVDSAKAPVRPERVMRAIDRHLKRGVVVGDASYASTWVTNYIGSAPGSRRILTPRGLAGIGWGFPMAIGAKLADPAAPVVYVGGDGAFGYNWSELETATRHKLQGLVAVVLNNGVFGYQKDAEDVALGEHTRPLHTSTVDHAAIARACGWNGIRIERAAEIDDAIAKALATPTPTLIDVISDPDAYPPIITFDGRLPDKVA